MKSKIIRRAQWYRMKAFFDGPAKVVTEVNDAEVLLQGVLYEASFPCPNCSRKIHMDKVKLREDGKADLSPQLGLCLIPQEAVGNQQGEALRRMIEANLRMPVLLISNNVQMVHLKPIMQAEADRILEGAGEDGKAEGKLLAIPVSNREAEPEGGEGARAGGGPESPGDPGTGTPPEDGAGQGEAGDPDQDAQGAGQVDPVGGDDGAPGASETQRDPAG